MTRQKRTYALPADTLKRFEQVVETGRRSAVITQLMDKWLDERRKEQLRREIEEGLEDMWDVLLEEEKAWNPADAELDRAFGI